MTPDISVIAPVYNVEPFLRHCVDSVLSQEGPVFELILIDDGSTDACGRICDEYAERDSRVRVVHKPNGGLSSARNRGMDEAKGEFLLFVDSDDYIVPGTLATLWKAQRETGADFVRAGYRNVLEDGLPDGYTGGAVYFHPPRRGFAYMEELDGKPAIMFIGAAWMLLERREVIVRHGLRFPEDVLQGEDWPFTVRLAEITDAEGLRYHFVDEELYRYRRQTLNSITATYSPTKSRRAREALARIGYLRAYLERTNPREKVDAALGDIYVNHVFRYLVVCAADSLAGVSDDAYARFRQAFLSSELRRALVRYDPEAGRGKSRLLPWLIRMRQPWLAFRLCRSKAARRYGRELAELRRQRGAS